MRPDNKTETLRCPLPDVEKMKLAEYLAQVLEDMDNAEADKADYNAGFKSRMESLLKARQAAQESLIRGFTMRPVECKILYNDPALRNKTIVRMDTGEVVRVEEMSEEECQENLPLENVPNTPAPAKESLLPVPMEPDGAKGPDLQSAVPGNDEQLRGGVSGRIPGSDQPQRATEEDTIIENDPLYGDAVTLVVEFGKAFTSLLQRRLRIGYGRAAHLIDLMERDAVVGPADGPNPREVLKRPAPLPTVPAPIVEPAIQESAKQTVEHGSSGGKRKRTRAKDDPQTQGVGVYPA